MLVPFTIVPLIISFISVYRRGEFFCGLTYVGIIYGLILLWSAFVIDSRVAESMAWGAMVPQNTFALYLSGVCCIASLILARKYKSY